MEKANYLSSVSDGAAWNWNFLCMCYGNCVAIIDWRLAVEKLWLITQHRFDDKSEQATVRASAQKQLLTESGLSLILSNIPNRPPAVPPFSNSERPSQYVHGT